MRPRCHLAFTFLMIARYLTPYGSLCERVWRASVTKVAAINEPFSRNPCLLLVLIVMVVSYMPIQAVDE